MTDRHQLRGLPQIPLTDLARPIDRPLMRAQLQEDRTDLAQIVINDRLAAIKPQRLDLLPHPHARQLRVVLQQPVDLVLERIQLRRPLRHPENRRVGRPQRRPNRVPRQPRPAHQLLDRHAANEMLPAQFGPALHVQHAFLPASINKTEPGSPSPRTPPPPPPGGSNLNRRRGVSLSPAPTSGPASALMRGCHDLPARGNVWAGWLLRQRLSPSTSVMRRWF